MKLFIIALAFFGLFACAVDKKSEATLDNLRIRNSIKDTLRQILRDSVLNSSAVGEAAIETPEYRRTNWVIKTSTNEELKELTRADNAFLKAIGLEGLFKKRDKEWFNYLIPMLRDTGQYVAFQDGCLRFDYRLTEYCLVEVLRYEYMDGFLTKGQTDKIDSMIEKYKIKVLPKQSATNTMHVQ